MHLHLLAVTGRTPDSPQGTQSGFHQAAYPIQPRHIPSRLPPPGQEGINGRMPAPANQLRAGSVIIGFFRNKFLRSHAAN